MKKIFFLTLAFLSFGLGNAQDEINRLVKEGIKLHDEGRFEEALAKYDSALAFDKNHYLANYEKSLTFLMTQKFAECIAISRFLLQLEPDNTNTKAVYINLGSALDNKGEKEESIKEFTKAIQLFPDFHLLHFNRGVTFFNLNKIPEAKADFQNSVKLKPLHPGSHLFTGQLLQPDNRIPSMMARMVFLLAEPEGNRAKEVFTSFEKQVKKGVSDNPDGKGTTISIDAALLGDKKKDNDKENDFSLVDMMFTLTGAMEKEEKLKDLDIAQKLDIRLQSMINMLKEQQKKAKGFYWDFYTPFFIELKEKEHLLTASYIIMLNSGNDSVIKWLGDNGVKIDAFYKWLNEYKWMK